MTTHGVYRDKLPYGCPPHDAVVIKDSVVVYRLVKTDPATEKDFQSWRALNPHINRPSHVDECTACGVSVHNKYDAVRKMAKLPKFRNRFPAKMTLTKGAGTIKQQGKDRAHYTWWPMAAYDILATCKVQP